LNPAEIARPETGFGGMAINLACLSVNRERTRGVAHPPEIAPIRKITGQADQALVLLKEQAPSR
jgi:hypothetical protein